jgi:integrase
MGMLAECPKCHKKQGPKNNICGCGHNLKQAKKSNKVAYWISYQVAGKTRREKVGKSIDEARDALGKRRVQRREKRFFDMRPDLETTFKDLCKWYLNLETTKDLVSYKTIRIYLGKFNKEFGKKIVGDVKLADLENHQAKRKREGLKPKTIDHELNSIKTVIWAAFKNDKVSGEVLKTFQNVKKQLKAHSNRRDRVLTLEEYTRLETACPVHLKGVVSMGYWTGMRKGEIINLTWDRLNMKERFIHLKAEDTKDREPRSIPMSDELYAMVSRLPRPIHNSHVFLYWGKPIEKRFETGLKSACKKAGITWGREIEGGFIFHDLRHTFITDARKAGVDRTVRMNLTGHAIKDMDQRYDVVDDEDKRQAIRKLESFRKPVTKTVTKKL